MSGYKAGLEGLQVIPAIIIWQEICLNDFLLLPVNMNDCLSHTT